MIGLMGGTFNPFHMGHYNAVLLAISRFKLSTLYVVPAALPPHKEYESSVSALARLEMTKEALKDIENVVVSDMEIKRGGKSYTIDTVKQILHEQNIKSLYLFIGSDMLYSFTEWKNPSELSKLCTIKVFMRYGGEYLKAKCEAEKLSEFYGGDFEVLNNEIFELSSTDLRSMINRGECCKGLIPEATEKYIRQNNLYV